MSGEEHSATTTTTTTSNVWSESDLDKSWDDHDSKICAKPNPFSVVASGKRLTDHKPYSRSNSDLGNRGTSPQSKNSDCFNNKKISHSSSFESFSTLNECNKSTRPSTKSSGRRTPCSSSRPSSRGSNDSTASRGSPREIIKSILYIERGLADWNQLNSIIKKAIKMSGIKCTYDIVMPKDESGTFKKFAFVWFSDVRIPNILMGNNPDGTARIEEKDDPHWVPPEDYERYDEILDEKLKGVTDWAEQADIEEELIRKYRAPKIKVKMQPLLTLPDYRYNPEQLKQITRSRRNADVSSSEDGKNKKINKFGTVNLNYATTRRHRPGKSTHVLFGKVPEWMTTEKLKSHFDRYVTVSDGSYPLVKIVKRYDRKERKEKFIAYITFSPASLDAQSAQTMSYDFTYSDRQHGKTKLHFKHPDDRRSG